MFMEKVTLEMIYREILVIQKQLDRIEQHIKHQASKS